MLALLPREAGRLKKGGIEGEEESSRVVASRWGEEESRSCEARRSLLLLLSAARKFIGRGGVDMAVVGSIADAIRKSPERTSGDKEKRLAGRVDPAVHEGIAAAVKRDGDDEMDRRTETRRQWTLEARSGSEWRGERARKENEKRTEERKEGKSERKAWSATGVEPTTHRCKNAIVKN